MAFPLLPLAIIGGGFWFLTRKKRAASSEVNGGVSTWQPISRGEAANAIPGWSPKYRPEDPSVNAMAISIIKKGSLVALVVRNDRGVTTPVVVRVIDVSSTPFGPSYVGEVVPQSASMAGLPIERPAVGTRFTFGPPQVVDAGAPV